jgi:uroporphyrinogen decarboxylase
MVEEPEQVLAECDAEVNRFLAVAEKLKADGVGIDGFTLCSDYCFNTGPFLSPAWFDEFVAPFLRKEIQAYRDMGYYVIKHTDGNIMPILDQVVECRPHAIHSLDPQAGVDIAEVKRRCGDRVCLIGNVNCGLMDTGTDEEVAASARYSLRHGMPGYGYIFSTSNCVYTGMPLAKYELMLNVWRKELGMCNNSDLLLRRGNELTEPVFDISDTIDIPDKFLGPNPLVHPFLIHQR